MEHGLPKCLLHGWAVFRGFGGLCFANLGEIGQKLLKAHISFWPNATITGFDKLELNRCNYWYNSGRMGVAKNRINGPVIIPPNQRHESSSHYKRNHRQHFPTFAQENKTLQHWLKLNLFYYGCFTLQIVSAIITTLAIKVWEHILCCRRLKKQMESLFSHFF